VPPIVDIGRYERQTRGRVDYILVFGNTGSLGDESEMGEIKLYGNQMAAYQLVSSGQSGNLRLYHCSSPYSGDGESCNSL
jgi:hypothetical protein